MSSYLDDPNVLPGRLAVSSNNWLRDYRRLTKMHTAPAPMPEISPVTCRVDDRVFDTGVLTRGRKSFLPTQALDRISSEKYPVHQPPVVNFVMGSNTRLIGREPAVRYE